MANPRYTGKEVRPTFGTMTKEWKSISIKENLNDSETRSADTKFNQRVDTYGDAEMTITGIDTDNATGYTFAEVQALIGKSPSALTFTDDAGTPASKLRSDFFTDFPLSSWRVREANGEWSEDPADWSITLRPGFLNAARA